MLSGYEPRLPGRDELLVAVSDGRFRRIPTGHSPVFAELPSGSLAHARGRASSTRIPASAIQPYGLSFPGGALRCLRDWRTTRAQFLITERIGLPIRLVVSDCASELL